MEGDYRRSVLGEYSEEGARVETANVWYFFIFKAFNAKCIPFRKIDSQMKSNPIILKITKYKVGQDTEQQNG
jgi:hypothetical protein